MCHVCVGERQDKDRGYVWETQGEGVVWVRTIKIAFLCPVYCLTTRMLLRDLLCFGFRILVRARVRQSCCRQCNSDYTGHTRPAMRLRNVGLPPYICMYSLLAIISAHNVNVTNVRVITREDNVGGSFGYSGALYSSDIGTLE